MATTKRPHRPSRSTSTIPTFEIPVEAYRSEVVVKLERALEAAESGDTIGALIVAFDHDGKWTADLAGQLRFDRQALNTVVFRMRDACMKAAS
ncbi:MAG: hypothetical protein JWP38_1326 [Herbaspirillum sp.]|jgi:hypothetical protein|nr:hypothetical protein [Herbaspirillum sp.]